MWYDVHTMGKASLLTPVYFFSSIRAGSGKSTMLANLAIYLNNINQRIAIVDLDSDTPLKLKNTFPRSISLQEYPDVSLISQNQDSRYQKNFYFTETSLISYFPAQKLKDASMLFSDTTLRDFFIQITACFDTVMVNFPAGAQHSRQASLLLARQHLWRGKSPVSIIVSQSDEKSLVSLDNLICENPAFYYQLQENTLLLFNRVPATVEDQKLAENTLNSLELRSLFNFPATFVCGINEEFPHQRQLAAPLVLDQNSVIHQTVAGLQRMLTGTVRSLSRALFEQTNDYQPCLDGQLLEKLSPYLDKIQATSARRLFQHPPDIQVFLEENEGNYRIRIRLTGVKQPLAGIQRKIAMQIKHSIRDRLSPAIWQFRRNYELPDQEGFTLKKERAALSVKPVYRFDDRFGSSIDCRLRCNFELKPERGRYPSPILFKPDLEMPEIPSLSEVLGYMRKQFKKCSFAPDKEFARPGVTHFFIPPEFDLSTTYSPLFWPEYQGLLQLTERKTLQHSIDFCQAGQLLERSLDKPCDLPDVFARNWAIVTESRFEAEVTCKISRNLAAKTLDLGRINHTPPILNSGSYLERHDSLPVIRGHEIPPIIYISVSAFIGLPNSRNKPIRAENYEWRDSFFPRPLGYAHCELNSNISCQLVMIAAATKSQQKDYFSFTFSDEVKVYRTAIFAKTEVETPRRFALDSGRPDKENYIPWAELRLPETFKLADVMIDHFFAPTVYKLPHNNSFSTEKGTRLYSFSHPTLFQNTYSEPVAEAMKKALSLSRAELAHKFSAAGHDYYNLGYRKSKSQPALRDQILKSFYAPEKLKSYRDISSIQATRTDYLLDERLKKLKFLPHKPRITEIRTILGRPPVLSHLPEKRPLLAAAALTSQKLVYRQLSFRKQPEKFSAATAPHLVQIIPAQNESNKMPAGNTYKSDSLNITAAKTTFTVEAPDLFTLSIRIGSRQIYHAVSTSLKDRIDINTMIETTNFDYQHVYSEAFVEPVFSNMFPTFADCPLRTRKIELPNSLAFPILAAEKEALDHASSLNFQTERSFKADYGIDIPAIRPAYDNLLMTRQSLPKSASKTWKSLQLTRKHFRPLFPDEIETLYRHLLWSFAAKRKQPAAFSAASLTRKENASLFRTNDAGPLDAANYRDKGLSPSARLKQNFLRDAIKVSKLRLKDVMSLARQASEKFSQVTSQLRA
ncbi:MAG: hypothetical protein GQF41_3112 [Candidatus Rifleibacterium amylolyticum]|nr:MAG: hypothetical protein GQF41_3112 [Candidatus Rifleibacterium amylolyticum]